MRSILGSFLSLFLLGSAPAVAQNALPANLPVGLGACYTPVETYPYKLSKSDPLFETALTDHQRYLEELEDYVNCLDRERSQALSELRTSFDLFMSNFGRDAVLKYAAEKQARD